MKRTFFLFILIFLGFSQVKVSADEIRIGLSPPIPPFHIEDKTNPGIDVEIIEKSFTEVGYKASFTFYRSILRLKDELRLGKVDAISMVRPETGEEGTFYSDPQVILHNLAFSRKRKGFKINNIEDLTHHSIAAWQGAYKDLGREYFKYFNPTVKSDYKQYYHEISEQKRQVMLFWTDRVDVIVIDKDIFTHLTRQMPSYVDTSDELQRHDIFPKETVWFVGFTKEKIRDDFNRGLTIIRKNGTYDKIYSTYIGDHNVTIQ